MDRKKHETEEELNKPATLILAAPTTTTKATNISTKPIDDDEDDASIESCDTFETWTLINDKEKSKFRCNLENDSGNRIEILKNSDHDETDHHNDEEDETEQEPQLQDSLADVSHEDYSDGISIISESESVDRMSPHPYVIDHIHDMKFSLNELLDDTILNGMREAMENDMVPALVQHQNQEPTADQQLRHRRISATAATNTDNHNDHALQKASQTVANTSGFVPLVKRGLQGIFYMGVGLALLGLIGKIINPTWQPLATDANSLSAAELEEKMNGMELQNNLMRAEIDLLNKQVKYLSSLSDRQQPSAGKYNKDYKQSKTFKAWPGNGDTLQPVDITKQDLRKPYKCPDGSFVEIANMCIEKRPANEPSIIDQLGQVMEDLKEKSEAFKTFEGVAEEFQGLEENPFEPKGSKEQVNTETPTKQQFIKNKSIYDTLKGNKENLPYADRYQKLWPKEDSDEVYKASTGYKKTYDKDEYRYKPLTKEYKKRPDYENVRDNSEERNQWKTDKFGSNSKENKKFRKDNSKEHHYTRDFNESKENFKENQSKEQRYNKQKRKADDDNSGEWHERYMKDREQQRKQNEEKYQDNKNWYIKRGNSRENRRSGEKQYR